MVDAPTLLGIVGIVILAGFTGHVLFERTGIPETLILIGLGLLLGPVTRIFPPESLLPAAPYVGALALMMILFEGGFSLEIRQTAGQFGSAALLMLVALVSSSAGVALLMWASGALPAAPAILLGSIMGATSGPIIIPIVNRMRVSARVKTILSVESSLGDALTILITVMAARALAGGAGDGGGLQGFLPALVTGLVFGIAAGVGLLYVLEMMGRRPLTYVFTFAALLLVYSLVESVHASGALAVLSFGMILGNGSMVSGWLGLPQGRQGAPVTVVRQTLQWFHGEISFIVRTFFFVFLGMIVDPAAFDIHAVGRAFGILAVLIATRWIAVRLTPKAAGDATDRAALLVMIPRGLAAAVLAAHPLVLAVPGSSAIFNTTVAVIILTNVFTVAGVAWIERRSPAASTAARK